VEWFVLFVWLIVLLVALPLGAGPVRGWVSLAIQALAAIAGFALVIAYIADNQSSAWAWAAAAAGVAGVLAVSVAAAHLVSDREGAVRATNQRAEERDGMLAGVELPLLVVAALLTMLLALGIGTSS
jgi:hypothetical protein